MKPPAYAHGPHLASLKKIADYGAVEWRGTKEVRTLMVTTNRINSIMVVSGAVGVGKSFAAGRAVEACSQDPECPSEVAWMELANSARGRALLAELYRQVTGTSPLRSATMAEMRDELAVVLSEYHRLLVVDEAQHASTEAMRELRWLMDRPTTDASLVIVGLEGIWKKLAPEIRSRTAYHVEFQAIHDEEVVDVLNDYHPLFTTADPALLRHVNATRARGRFRWWSLFLTAAVPYATRRRCGIDETLVEDVTQFKEAG